MRRDCGAKWTAIHSNDAAEDTLHQQDEAAKTEDTARQLEDPLVRAVLAVFPEAKLLGIKPIMAPESGEPDEVAPDDESEES